MLKALQARLVPLAIVAVGVALFFVCQSPALGTTLLVVSVVSLLAGPSFDVSRTNQVALAFMGLVFGVLAPRIFAVEEPLGQYVSDRTLLAACPALFVAAIRCVFRSPTGGAPLTAAIAVVALAGAGRAISPIYPWAVGAFVTLCLFGVAASDPDRAWPADASLSHVAKIVAALTLTALIAIGFAIGLPMLHAAIVQRITDRMHARTGFSTQIELGTLDGMLQSNEVVLRVRNGAPPLLRGGVFSRYQGNHWRDLDSNRKLYEPEHDRPTDGRWVEIEFPRRPERYFMPPDVVDVRTSSGLVYATSEGTRSPAPNSFAKRVWFLQGEPPSPPPPTADDYAVPRNLEPTFSPLAHAWARGTSDLEKMDALQEHLQREYKYAIHFERTPHVDPLIDFLSTHKEGHCEYFASAMVLLARTLGIPARLATGYRVVEASPLGDYHIVREQNAHAWVEVYADGRWHTFDPTPISDDASLAKTRTPFGAAALDLVATTWEKVDDFLAARSPFELTLALVALLGLLLFVRWFRGRGVAPATTAEQADPPLACYAELEAALSMRGHARAPHETLGSFADRVSRSEHLSDTAPVIRRYAELRYGGRDDEARVSEEIRALVHRLRAERAA